MADNTTLNANTTVGDTYASDDIGGVKHTRVKVQHGDPDSATDASEANPLPVMPIGETHIGTQSKMQVNAEGSVDVHFGTSTSAFGDLVSVTPDAKVQLMFPYDVATANVTQFAFGSGVVASVNSQAELSTGTTPQSDAAIASLDFMTYQPGYGATVRFTFGCTTAGDLSDTFQQVGIGTQEDGYFFSYQDNDMNILRRQGGLRDQIELLITTGASSAGNVDIELAGVTYNVPVTDSSGSGNFTAAEIAASPAMAASLYVITADGNAVTFQSARTGPRAGAFSFGGGTTGTAGNIARKVSGVDPTETLIPRTSWNIDQCDGNGPVLPLIDWSKGNVFQIRYQWLGYGAQSFYVENPNSSNLVLVHRILYSNTSVVPSVFNPSLRWLVNVNNGATTKDVTAFVASVAGMIDGGEPRGIFGNRHANSYAASVGNTSFDAIVNICSPLSFKGKSNRSEASLVRIGVTASAAANIHIIKNPTVMGGTSTWTEIDADTLLVFDQTSTTITGGKIVWTERAEKQDRFLIEPQSAGYDQIVKIYPGEVVSIAGQADTGSSLINVALNWIEPV
jgi:hypothetical protein